MPGMSGLEALQQIKAISPEVPVVMITKNEEEFLMEEAIGSHPAVDQVAVIGIPHETWGEQVHAIVVLKKGASATAEELIKHAHDRIAGYKVPKSVEFRTEPIPLSGAMKPLKRELRKPYWEGKATAIS